MTMHQDAVTVAQASCRHNEHDRSLEWSSPLRVSRMPPL
jgi:hypothetical protein